MFKTLLAVIVPLAIALAPAKADAQFRVSIGIAPPQAYIATTQPEYFEGRPVYWYNNNWYYRDHGRWSYYRTEPGYLHQRRARWVEQPRYREHDRDYDRDRDRDRDRNHDRDRDRDRRVDHDRDQDHDRDRGPARYRYRRCALALVRVVLATDKAFVRGTLVSPATSPRESSGPMPALHARSGRPIQRPMRSPLRRFRAACARLAIARGEVERSSCCCGCWRSTAMPAGSFGRAPPRER